MILRAIILILALLTAAQAGEKRSGWARAAFVAANPCPTTGRLGACPGYVVDHLQPLCNGGADRPENMAWQGRAEAREKDNAERALCRAARR
jgi:hypothetical protein